MATNKRLIKSNDEGGGGASFNTVIWSGDGNTDRSIDVGFAPDWVWVKERNPEGLSHNMYDVVRGAGQRLISNLTNAENTLAEGVKSFDPNGFTVGNSIAVNRSGSTFVAWCWKAGGAAVTNTDGTTPSQVSANTEAGFSIVTWTTNLSPATLRVGHGLGQTPDIVIFKRRSAPNEDWYVFSNLFDGSYMLLNSSSGLQSLGSSYSTSVTDTLLSSFTGVIGIDYVAYCFAEVAGFSKFGSYPGNGATGQTIYTTDDGTAGGANGFEPAFVMIKATNLASDWYMIDNKRPNNKFLAANKSNSEYTAGDTHTFTSNGFTLSGESFNNSGYNWIYMAFANQF